MKKRVALFLLLIVGQIAIACDDKTYAGIPTAPQPTVTLCRKDYVAVYSPTCKIPLVVIEHVDINQIGGTEPRQRFHVDRDLPDESRSTLADYAGSGYDIGHMAPAADFQTDSQAMHESFHLSNATPQVPKLNRGLWRALEIHARALAAKHGAVWVYNGVILSSAPKTIGDHVCVPDAYYKVIVEPKHDLVSAYFIPNTADVSGRYTVHRIAWSSVQRKAKVKLFPKDSRFSGKLE